MNARTTLIKAHNDLVWAARQLRNPDAVTEDVLQATLDSLRDTLESLESVRFRDLPAEQTAALAADIAAGRAE